MKIKFINARWGMAKVPKIGWVKFRRSRDLQGTITEATIVKTADGWQISLACKWEGEVAPLGGSVGIDRGVAVPLMLSDGTPYLLPERLAVLDKRYRKAQKIASRRKRGSVRHRKAQRRATKLAAKIARIRKRWAHETTTEITRKFGTVVIERLRTKDMTKSAAGTMENPGKNVGAKRGLNRAIMSVGWHQIEQMLFYKAHRIVKVDPAYTSQTCSACGNMDKRSRKNQASFVCTACGFRMNADQNAAINILQRGSTPFVESVKQTLKRELPSLATDLIENRGC